METLSAFSNLRLRCQCHLIDASRPSYDKLHDMHYYRASFFFVKVLKTGTVVADEKYLI